MTALAGARVRVEVEPFYPYLLRLYGVDEAEFDAMGDEDLKAEYMDGVMIVHSPASVRHEERQIFLAALLKFYLDSHPPGRVLGGNALFRVGPRRFAPDVMVVRDIQRVGMKEVDGAPDLAIEILSESTRHYDLNEKRMAYREMAIPEIWLVDLDQHVVLVERRSHEYRSEIVREGWVISEAVPGFRIRVEWLWQEPLPSVLECWEEMRGEG